jgi:hypothetical protein
LKNLVLRVCLCAEIQNYIYSGLSRTIFSHNQIFILYTNIKWLNTLTVFNSMYISIESVFFMCEGYTELAPLVAIFYTNMAVENKSSRL